MSKPKIGIALGGGGARGFAHIGVLQVLQQNEIEIDYVSGTSMGAIIGAIFCETYDAFEVEARVKAFMKSEAYEATGIPRVRDRIKQSGNFWDQVSSEIRGRIAVNIARSRKALIKAERLYAAIESLIEVMTFEECKIPFTVVATDILNGEDVIFRSGDLAIAVEASSSVPGFLPPVEYNGYILSDGGISCPVPVQYARNSKETLVIGVAVPPPIYANVSLDNAVEIMTRAEQITSSFYSKTQMKLADIGIYPDVKEIQWNEFEAIDDMIEAGRKTAQNKLATIKYEISKRRTLWSRLFENE